MNQRHLTPALAAAILSATVASAQYTGPSTTTAPYILPTESGWVSTSLLSVGDSIGGYRMVGIPDGLGAYDNQNGTITVLMNHELPNSAGIARAHGSIGAFVSQWTINKDTLQVTAGQDMILSPTDVYNWDNTAFVAGTTAFNRLCSADLPAFDAFYNNTTNLGYNGRIFMNGEETSNGRAYAWIATGSSAGEAWQLPHLGRFAWENSVASPFTGDKTVVIGLDDTSPGEVYMYVGTKSNTGTAIEMAGLTGGSLYGIKVTNGGANYAGGAVPNENAGAINGTFVLEAVDARVANQATAHTDLQTESGADGITLFARPEDGHWVDADTFVFVTTGRSGQTARLYRLDFTNAADLTLGGTVTMVLDAASLVGDDGAGARSFDNIVVGADGMVYIQEDPGGDNYIAKVWQVDLSNPLAAVQIFESNRSFFLPPTPSPYNVDEEHSGIIDVTGLFADAAWFVSGAKVFLGDTQAHYNITGELVQGGQLQLMTFGVAPIPEPSTYAALAGAVALAIVGLRRRRV